MVSLLTNILSYLLSSHHHFINITMNGLNNEINSLDGLSGSGSSGAGGSSAQLRSGLPPSSANPSRGDASPPVVARDSASPFSLFAHAQPSPPVADASSPFNLFAQSQGKLKLSQVGHLFFSQNEFNSLIFSQHNITFLFY